MFEIYSFSFGLLPIIKLPEELNDALYQVDGFANFRDYLMSDYVELLTFYGDTFNPETKEFLRNHIITVVDRHKIIDKKPNPS
jgi:hypothetical protein